MTMSGLAEGWLKCHDASLVVDEFRNTARMLLHGCERGLLRRGAEANEDTRRRLSADLNLIISEHRRLWLARNRPGGLKESEERLAQRLKEYT